MGKSVLNGAVSSRAGAVSAWRMELYHAAMAGQEQGFSFSAVKWESSCLPEPSRPTSALH